MVDMRAAEFTQTQHELDENVRLLYHYIISNVNQSESHRNFLMRQYQNISNNIDIFLDKFKYSSINALCN